MKPILWDTLLRSRKALPRAWNQLSVDARRKCFVTKTEKHLSWCCFKLWKLLTPKEQGQIKEKLHYKKDVERICKTIQKFLKSEKHKENNMSTKKKSDASDASSSDASSKSTKSKKSSKKVVKKVEKKDKKKTTKVVPIVDAMKVDCPKCKVHKGHRCVHTHAGSGKRDNPHRLRIQKAMKLAPKKKAA